MADFNRRDFLRATGGGIGGLLILDTLACGSSDGDDPDPKDATANNTSPDSSPDPDSGVDGPLSPDAGVDGPSADATEPDMGPDAFVAPDDVYKNFPTQFTEALIPTTCWIGKQDCGMLARVMTQTVAGKSISRIVKLEGNPDNPRNLGKLCPKGMGQLQAVYDYNRVKWPLKRTNAKGQPGTFQKISWADALAELASQLEDAKNNSKGVLWQKGRSKAKNFYDNAFVKALGAYGVSTTKIGHGSYCSDSGYRAAEYTLGYHGVISPDLAQTDYLLSWGWGLTTSGGNKLCWLTWPQKLIQAREQGTLKKVVCLDPNRRQTGPHADEWLPNRPGSDVAFFLGIANHLVNKTATGFANGLIDEEYLTKHTNAASLVLDDGTILRVGDKEQVWDTTSGGVKDFDDPAATPALVGSFTYNDGSGDLTVKPAYQRYKEHLAPYTPSWADGVTDLPAGTVAKVAQELFDHAKIGSTITIDGVELPHRPVSMMAYHVSQQETGFQAMRAGINVFQLLGAINVPGGIEVDFAPKELDKNWPKLNEVSIKTDNLSWTLGGSKFFPLSSSCPSFFHRAQLEPSKYDVDPNTIPSKVILHMVDPVVAFTDTPVLRDAYMLFEHVTAIQPWLSETADHYADLILPAATLEKYEGPMSCKTADESATCMRVPPVAPLWESKGDIDIYFDIADAGGFLDAYVTQVNNYVGVSLPTGSKPTAKAVFDAWAKGAGYSGIDFFETYNATGTKGVTPTKVHGAAKKYTRASNYFGARHRFYGEALLGYQMDQIAAGVDKIYYQDYTAYPTWREPTMWGSVSDGFNLHLLTHKQVQFKQSRASFVPILAELAPRQGLLINPATASGLGIADGDDINVTSHNALTKETRSVKTKAVLFDGIRPDTVSMSHHYGLTHHPSTAGQGPTPNDLYFAGEGYIQCTQDASFHVMVKVTKA